MSKQSNKTLGVWVGLAMGLCCAMVMAQAPAPAPGIAPSPAPEDAAGDAPPPAAAEVVPDAVVPDETMLTPITPEQPGEARPVPPDEVPAVPPAPLEAAAETHITTKNDELMMNFADVNIDVVLNELSAVAGFVIVKEVPTTGKVTLISRQPVKAKDAVLLLNTVLHNAGYAAIREGRILKITSTSSAKRMNIPVRVGNDPEKVERSDELITQVIPLRYADATQLKTDLQPLMNSEADFTANASSNALVITDTSSNIRRIVQVVAALDTSVADSVDVKVFQLKFANAANAAKLINDVFGNVDAAGGAQPQNPFFRRFPGGFPGGNNTQQNPQGARASRTTRVTASSDDRTNSIVVSGKADTLVLVAQVVKELDANPAAEEQVYVFKLRNAQALNVELVLNGVFLGASMGTRTGQTSLSSATGTSSVLSGSGTRSGNSSRTTTTTGGSTGGQRLSAQSQSTVTSLAGLVTIVGDVDTNSILVRASPLNYERIKPVLEELDRPATQVLIKVLIAEVTHDDSLDLGAEFSILNLHNGHSEKGSTGFNIGPALAASTTTPGMVVQLLESNFTATIRALETAGKLDVLSRPYILASDNQLANITVGQEFPFITSSVISDSGQVNNTIEYSDIGIILDVVPHINPDGQVILDVAPEISSISSETVAISENVNAVVIVKRSARSRVSVQSGRTIVIGGLMEDKLTSTVDKVPLLGDIPLLGELFKRTQNTKTKTELLIFLTPHVVSRSEQLDEMSKEEVKGTKLLPGAVAPGTYEEHREGLERGAAESGSAERPDTAAPAAAPAPEESK
ncbi:MAG: type II secretion system secretin GspD [Phycisphaerales bacterium]